MIDKSQVLSFFDHAPDSRLYDSEVSVQRLKKELAKFGLSPSQSKVFIFLGKYGPKTAGEISKIINLPRTETYRILTKLQNKGVLSSTFGHPTRFSVLTIDDALEVLVRTEIERAKMLQSHKAEVIDSWNSLPSFTEDDNCVRDEKFQILKGQNSIINKIKEMINGAQKNLLLLGPERYFMKLYHTDSLDLLENSSAEIRILTSSSSLANSMGIFSKKSQADIRKLPDRIHNDLCFMVKDENEIISFIKNAASAQDMIAIRTDSAALTYTMALLFNNIWSDSANLVPCQDNPRTRHKPLLSDLVCLQ